MSEGSSNLGSVSIGVCGRTQGQSKFEVAPGRNMHVDIPSTFSAEHVALAAKDAEIIQRLFTERPKEIEAIVAAVSAGNFKEAKKIGEKIGFTEDYFIKQGGGMWAIVIGIAIGCALLLAHD